MSVDDLEEVAHNSASLLLEMTTSVSAVRMAKSLAKRMGYARKLNKKLDAKKKPLHNLVSLLLANKTIRGVVRKGWQTGSLKNNSR